MKDYKIIDNYPAWVPLEKRVSRFGGPPPPRKPETRTPLLWLACENDGIYFVNASDELLDSVIAGGSGFATADDDVVTVGSASDYYYKNVLPNQAVKVEEYDGFYDLDFVLHVYVTVQSPSFGRLELRSPGEKGGVGETILLWDTGEPGKHVYIKKRSNSK